MALKFIDTATPKGNFPIAYASDIVMDDDRLNENLETTIDTLKTRVDNLSNLGRFLAIWDASTGLPTSNPTESPYTYHVGDYYRIGVAGTRNPAPNLTYTIGGTNWVTGEQLGVGDCVYISNVSATATTWVRQASSGGGTVQDVQVDGVSKLSGGIANIDEVPASIVTGQLNANQIPSLDASKIISGQFGDEMIESAETWNAKQDALASQSSYTSKGSATKVAQITTNSLGQVTNITEVAIAKTTLSDLNITATASELNKLDGATVTTTELNYVHGVTSNIQTQLNSKISNLSGLGITATAQEINVLDGITASTTELNYMGGVTSSVQTQLNAKQPIVMIRSVTE